MAFRLRRYLSARSFTLRNAALTMSFCTGPAFLIYLMSSYLLEIGTSSMESNYRLDHAVEARALEKTELQFLERRESYLRACDTQRIPGDVDQVFYHQASHLSVCHVPKVGCTFWKRVFHFLYNETWDKKVSSPFDIDRYDVHFRSPKKVQVLKYGFWQVLNRLYVDHTAKVLFTRDPYARLWSVYVDKFILPDSWLDHGAAILMRRRNQQRRQRQAGGSEERQSGHVEEKDEDQDGPAGCASDISFEEFLRYALFVRHDPHWMPVHLVCNPCIFRPHFVGKMETFSHDSKTILKRVGLSKLLEGRNHSHYTQEEVRMLTVYHFRLYGARPLMHLCLKHSGVAYHLWQAFVLNGYINKTVTIPQEALAELDKVPTAEAGALATRLMLELHNRSPALTSKQLKAHRRRVLVEHYRALDPRLLEQLANTFRGDFTLFGYEERPKDIFRR